MAPSSYKADMTVTLADITCPPDRGEEIWEILEDQFREVDLRGFTLTLSSTKNKYVTDACEVKWKVSSVTGVTDPADLTPLAETLWSALRAGIIGLESNDADASTLVS